jgi:uncharacterized protein YndB with AHSA1/START domain
MKASRHGSATVSFPNERDVLVTRNFDASAERVFDALTMPEHVRRWYGARELEVCEIDLRVGGEFHFVGYILDGDDDTCSFRGTYMEIERPWRTVSTWVFDGLPHADAIESFELRDDRGFTILINRLTFRDRSTRDSIKWSAEDGEHAADGGQAAYDRLEDYLSASS